MRGDGVRLRRRMGVVMAVHGMRLVVGMYRQVVRLLLSLPPLPPGGLLLLLRMRRHYHHHGLRSIGVVSVVSLGIGLEVGVGVSHLVAGPVHLLLLLLLLVPMTLAGRRRLHFHCHRRLVGMGHDWLGRIPVGREAVRRCRRRLGMGGRGEHDRHPAVVML